MSFSIVVGSIKWRMGLMYNKIHIVKAHDLWYTITGNKVGKVSSFYSDNDTTILTSIAESQNGNKFIGGKPFLKESLSSTLKLSLKFHQSSELKYKPW